MPAKFNILVAASIPLVPLIPLLACGGDSKTPDASIHVIDSPGSGSGSNVTCNIPASLGTPTFTNPGALYYPGSGSDLTNELIWKGTVMGATPQVGFDVLIFGGCGTAGSACNGNGTPDWPTTFGAKANLDLSMVPDALVAVLGNPNMSTNRYQDFYFAVSGTLNVTQASNIVGQPFAGNGANIVAQHYDLGSNSVTPDPDNCMSMVTSFTFSGSAQMGSAVGKVVVLDGTDRVEALRNYLAHRYVQ